jgi:hypothetical protein
MALSTNLAVMRSSGGDQTKTAYPGSIPMVAPFYIADASPATAGTQVKVSSASGAQSLILPAGAVVSSVSITTETGSGTFDLGYTAVANSATTDNNGIATGVTVALGTTNLGSVVTGDPLPAMAYVTVTDNTSATGAVTGYITYFVPSNGQYL